MSGSSSKPAIEEWRGPQCFVDSRVSAPIAGLHTAKILRLSSDLPIVVEIVDTENKIESFLPLIDDAIGEGLATVERVEVRFYRSGSLQGLTRVPNEDG